MLLFPSESTIPFSATSESLTQMSGYACPPVPFGITVMKGTSLIICCNAKMAAEYFLKQWLFIKSDFLGRRPREAFANNALSANDSGIHLLSTFTRQTILCQLTVLVLSSAVRIPRFTSCIALKDKQPLVCFLIESVETVASCKKGLKSSGQLC